MQNEKVSADRTVSHLWTTRFTVSLSGIIALFGTWGWLTHFGLFPRELAVAAGGLLMAGVCLVAQGVCNNLAIEARRARARGLRWSFRWALVVALGFGSVSALGLHHGWEIAKAVAPDLGVLPPPDWLTTTLFIFIAFGEPISFWVVDAIKGAANGPAPSVAAAEPLVIAGQSLLKAVGGTKPPKPTNENVKKLVGAAAAATLAMGAVNSGLTAQPAETASAQTQRTDRKSFDFGQAKSLAEQGWSERRIAREMGGTRHAVRVALGR